MNELQTFYLAVIIASLAVSILVYPTMVERARREGKKKRR